MRSCVQPYPIALGYAYLVLEAYSVFEKYNQQGNPNANPAQSDYPNFPSGYTLVYNVHMTDFSPLGSSPVLYGFLAKSTSGPTTYVLAIRGTQGWKEWFDDLDFKPTSFPNSQGYVPGGFYSIYDTMTYSLPGNPEPVGFLKNIHKDLGIDTTGSKPFPTLVCTGHSLGAPLVTYFAVQTAAMGIVPRVYTFASPNTGDAQFVSYYDGLVANTYRFYNYKDWVPTLPPDYNQVNGGIELNSENCSNLWSTPGCAHYLTTYMYMMGGPLSLVNNNCIYTGLI